jgi:HSP20 family protein
MLDLIPWRRRKEETAAGWPTELRREFDGLVNRVFGEERWLSPSRVFSKGFSPTVDISDTENEILVKVDVPGIDPNDLSVDIAGDTLTLKGERKQEKEEQTQCAYRVERSYGSFSRSFRLPVEIQADKVEARYKNGVLSLKLPKIKSDKKTPIRIRVEGSEKPESQEEPLI